MKGLNQICAKIFILFGSKFLFLSLVEVAVEGRFVCIDMELLIEIAQINSSCFSFVLFTGKCAIHKLDCWTQSRAQIWKNSNMLRIFFDAADE